MNINQVYKYILNELNNNYENIIIGEIYINKDNIHKDIQIINSFENYKRKLNLGNEKNDYEYENEKEIKENILIKINGKIIEFTYFYKFKEERKYIIEYLFKNNLTKTNQMFSYCESLTNLNLSNFNIQNVVYMTGSFFECKSLTYLNLSNFNNDNLNDMNAMFYACN